VQINIGTTRQISEHTKLLKITEKTASTTLLLRAWGGGSNSSTNPQEAVFEVCKNASNTTVCDDF